VGEWNFETEKLACDLWFT